MNIRIIEGSVPDGKPSRPRYRTARDRDREVRVRVVDADSPSFGADFAAAFAENVRRVRRDNRQGQIAAE